MIFITGILVHIPQVNGYMYVIKGTGNMKMHLILIAPYLSMKKTKPYMSGITNICVHRFEFRWLITSGNF